MRMSFIFKFFVQNFSFLNEIMIGYCKTCLVYVLNRILENTYKGVKIIDPKCSTLLYLWKIVVKTLSFSFLFNPIRRHWKIPNLVKETQPVTKLKFFCAKWCTNSPFRKC